MILKVWRRHAVREAMDVHRLDMGLSSPPFTVNSLKVRTVDRCCRMDLMRMMTQVCGAQCTQGGIEQIQGSPQPDSSQILTMFVCGSG